MHRKLIKEIVQNKDKIRMEELECIVICMMDEIKKTDHDLYKRIEYKLYKLVYGEHLNEELAHKWVNKMENKDGTIGEHWTIEQTTQYAASHNKYDWYVAMNMAYSDYYNTSFDVATYVQLAKDWLADKDVGEGKILKYYFYVVCDKHN